MISDQPEGKKTVVDRLPRYRWLVLVMAFVVHATYTLLQQGVSILAPFFHASFDLNLAEVGLLVSSFNAGLMISSLPAGWFVDRVSGRLSVAFGAAGAFTCSILAVTAKQPAAITAAFLFLAGLLSATQISSSSKAVFGWFDSRERGMAMGLRQVAIPAGAATAAVLLPWLGLLGGWQLGLTVAACLHLTMGALFVIIYRDPPSTGTRPAPRLVTAMRDILSDRQLVLVAVVSMILVLAQYIILAYLILYLVGEGLSPVLAGTGLLLVQIGAVAGRTLWGRVSDRFFLGARTPVVARLIFLSALTVGSLALTRGSWPLWLIYLQLLLVGGTSMSWNGLIVTLMAELSGFHRAGAAVGLNSTLVFLGALIAAPIFGATVDATHSYQLGFLGLGVVIILAFIPLSLVREKQAIHQPALITP